MLRYGCIASFLFGRKERSSVQYPVPETFLFQSGKGHRVDEFSVLLGSKV